MSPQAPYVPMKPPQKQVSQERMREILSRRSGTTSHAAQSAQPKDDLQAWPTAIGETAEIPSRPRGPLQWQKPEAGSMGVRTVCEWYSCCKVRTEQDGPYLYEVWTREPLTRGMQQLAVGLASFEEAKQIAQADADRVRTGG